MDASPTHHPAAFVTILYHIITTLELANFPQGIFFIIIEREEQKKRSKPSLKSDGVN